MVPLPLFKLATLFVRHVSKYGANRIKAQAHDHPNFRALAARYGQAIHQLNMRLQVAVLRNTDAEARARERFEKGEAPTVKTREQTERDDKRALKMGASSSSSIPPSVWRRKFRPLPENRAVELFADVLGDAFILSVAAALIVYEYWRSSVKPDYNLEQIRLLQERVAEMQDERERVEKEWSERMERVEASLEEKKGVLQKRLECAKENKENKENNMGPK